MLRLGFLPLPSLGEPFDDRGKLAAKGNVLRAVLAAALAHINAAGGWRKGVENLLIHQHVIQADFGLPESALAGADAEGIEVGREAAGC